MLVEPNLIFEEKKEAWERAETDGAKRRDMELVSLATLGMVKDGRWKSKMGVFGFFG